MGNVVPNGPKRQRHRKEEMIGENVGNDPTDGSRGYVVFRDFGVCDFAHIGRIRLFEFEKQYNITVSHNFLSSRKIKG
jgi:hypothetical protein